MMEAEDEEIIEETRRAIRELSLAQQQAAERCAAVLRHMVAEFGEAARLAIMLVHLEEATRALE
jgi:hypothetical protein